MSYNTHVSFRCDSCDTNFTIDEENMELPPGWLGLQIIAADTEGCIPDHERENYSHFCSQACLIQYTASTDMRKRLVMVDKTPNEDDESEEA